MTGVILIPDLTYLDPDVTEFTTMLAKLAARHWVAAGNLRKGDFVNEGGSQWYVTAIMLRNPDDWFSDERVAILEKPWREKPTNTRVAWLEDTLFYGRKW